MLLVFAMAAVLWGVGALTGAPKNARLLMIGILYVGVLGLHVALPDGHPLRMATGEDAAFWLILGGMVALVLTYRKGLQYIRNQAKAAQAVDTPRQQPGAFSETELNRYARHIILREVGGPGQKRLKDARVLVVGAGGLGAPALQYLAAAGIGTIGVIDDDVVDNSNLQRQVIHKDQSIGVPKVFSAEQEMKAQNPFVVVRPYNRRLSEEVAEDLFSEYDLILDGTDNFTTRYLVNRAAVAAGVPLVSGALSQWEGQLSVFDPASGAPCYQCVFAEAPAPELAPSCAEAGVIGPLPGVIGSMMAVEAVKLLTGAGTALRGQMFIYDALYGESRQISISKRADCPVCGQKEAVAS